MEQGGADVGDRDVEGAGAGGAADLAADEAAADHRDVPCPGEGGVDGAGIGRGAQHPHPLRVQRGAGEVAGLDTGGDDQSVEDESYVTASPRDPRAAVGIFQQDRWSNGGARGLTATYTRDGRHFTETSLPFSHCAPGGLNYQRASDGWVSTGPDGIVYASGLVFDATDARNGVAASTSYDGGRTWTHTTPLIDDTQAQFSNDKNSVTADPVHPGVAYQVWDRIDEDDAAKVYDGPAYISITRDGGRHWSKARPFVDTSVVPHAQTIGNVIVVDPRTDTLYDVFDWQTYAIDYATSTFTPTDLHFAVVKSSDQGRTWSKPVTIAKDTAAPEVDPNAPSDTTKALRAGGDLPNVAVDPHTGELYVAYEGSDFSGGAHNSVELIHSTDGGRTWSAPKRVNSVASAPAFTPSIGVDARGTVAITYYDLRYLTAGNTSTRPAPGPGRRGTLPPKHQQRFMTCAVVAAAFGLVSTQSCAASNDTRPTPALAGALPGGHGLTVPYDGTARRMPVSLSLLSLPRRAACASRQSVDGIHMDRWSLARRGYIRTHRQWADRQHSRATGREGRTRRRAQQLARAADAG